MINEELLNLLSQIQDSIRNGDIKGYKDLLYLIYQNNQMENHEEISAIINDFIEILFRENMITESNECNNCPPKEDGYDKGLTYGKEKSVMSEYRDIIIMGQFHGLIPLVALPSVEQNIRQRFEV